MDMYNTWEITDGLSEKLAGRRNVEKEEEYQKYSGKGK
jgi:hypothetical protein